MVLLKTLWALFVIGSQVRGTPLPNTRHADMKMTAQSHPMLASVFSTANNAKMINFSNRQFEVKKPTKGAIGGWTDGTPGNRDVFMDISNKISIGDMKAIPRNRGAEFGTGFQGKNVEKTKIPHSIPHVATGIENRNGGKRINEGLPKSQTDISVIDTLSGGICAYCQQTQNITCMQRYCSKDAPAASRDLLIQGNMKVQDGANKNTESHSVHLNNAKTNKAVHPNFQGKLPILTNNMNRPNMVMHGGMSPEDVPLSEAGLPTHNVHPRIRPVDMFGNRKTINVAVSGFPANGQNSVPLSEKVNPNIPRENINVKQSPDMAVPNGQFIPFEIVEPVNIGQVHPNSRPVIGAAGAGSVPLSNTFGAPRFTVTDAAVNDVQSPQHLHPSDKRPMTPRVVFPGDGQPRPDFVPIETARLLSVAPEFPFSNMGVQQSGNTGAIFPLAPETPFTNNQDTNPSTIDAAITDVNSFMQRQLPLAPEVPFSNMGVPHSGNERSMLPIAQENLFVNVGAPNPSIMEAAINDANSFQKGNADPNAISFDNEFRQSDTQAASSTGMIPQRPNVVPRDHFSLDTEFQQANGLRPVDPVSGTHNRPSDLMPNNNQHSSFDLVQFEAMRPFEGLQGNDIVNNIRNQNLADIPVDVQASIVPMNVPSARPFDAMNPLTGNHEAALPQAAGNQNNVQPIVPNVAVVSSAQDFFALKPHSRITGMQRRIPVTANDQVQDQFQVQGQRDALVRQNPIGATNQFLLNDMGQPIQTFAELNKKIHDVHVTKHQRSNPFIQEPVQSNKSQLNLRPAMVGQGGVVQTSTMLPTAFTIITKSPQRKAELNALSKTFLTEIVL